MCKQKQKPFHYLKSSYEAKNYVPQQKVTGT